MREYVLNTEAMLAAKGITAAALCREAKINKSTWTKWKSGKITKVFMPTFERVDSAVARLLGE